MTGFVEAFFKGAFFTGVAFFSAAVFLVEAFVAFLVAIVLLFSSLNITFLYRKNVTSMYRSSAYFSRLLHWLSNSVFVHNVFSPNGDGKNDSFSITLFHQDDDTGDGDSQDDLHYDVYNRYGRKIFTAPATEPWTGGDFESAVYFWYGTYHSCQGQARTIKGIVHLVK
jgi:hypothetical protein